MWDDVLIDSDEEYFSPDEDPPWSAKAQEPPPPPGITGLALAEHYFGPLLSPVAASPAEWTAYTEHRRSTNAEYNNVSDRRKRYISSAIAGMEVELGLANGALQKCVSSLARGVWYDDVHPRIIEVSVRIYSPATPGYVDVHFGFQCLPKMDYVVWVYGLGYKLHSHAFGPSTGYRHPSTDGFSSSWYSRDGWRPISWGYYDNSDYDYGRDWREVEKGEVELSEEGVLDIHKVLFGTIDAPHSDDADAVLAYRRKLVATVRLLFAAVGIDYQVACKDGERDEGSHTFGLEGLSDGWVARGIRAACGFQLSGDPEAAKRGKEERLREATRKLYNEDSDDDEDDESDEDEDGMHD